MSSFVLYNKLSTVSTERPKLIYRAKLKPILTHVSNFSLCQTRHSALRVFSVESNHIGTIDGKFFKRNPKLEMVYLADNELEEVSPVLFKHNSNLEFLHLDKNKVILINDIISSSR